MDTPTNHHFNDTDMDGQRKQLELESRITTLDDEIAGVKEDIGSVKKDVGLVQLELRSISNTQGLMQTAQREGLSEIKDMMKRQSDAPPKFGMGIITGFISILATGVLALWATINLLVSPIAKNLNTHEQNGHPDTEKAIALLLERTSADSKYTEVALRDVRTRGDESSARQQEEIETLYRLEEKNVERLIESAKTEGQAKVIDEWLKSDVDSLKSQVDQLTRLVHELVKSR